MLIRGDIMLNQLVLVGQIRRIPDSHVIDGDNELIIEVKRNYKNMQGVFESDFFKCYLWFAISKKISLNCKIGDLVVVKGRLVDADNACKIIAEQVVLLNKSIENEAFVR